MDEYKIEVMRAVGGKLSGPAAIETHWRDGHVSCVDYEGDRRIEREKRLGMPWTQ